MEMRPEVASKSAAVKVATPLVLPSAAAFAIESVEPEKERGLDTVVACTLPALSVERSVEVSAVKYDAPETLSAVVDA